MILWIDESTGESVRTHLENIRRFSAEHEKTHFIQVKLQDSTVKMVCYYYLLYKLHLLQIAFGNNIQYVI